MLTTTRPDHRPIDNQACIGAMLAVVRMTAGIDFLKVEGDPTELRTAIHELGDAVVNQLSDAQVEPLIAAVLTAANAYYQAPVEISVHLCDQTRQLMLLLYPVGLALLRPQGASLH